MSYYAPPIPDERLRPFAEQLAAQMGMTTGHATWLIRQIVARHRNSRTTPRYMRTLDGRHVRLWGKPLIHNGKKSRR